MRIPSLIQTTSALWYALKESSCLGMQLKMGGELHLKLNIGERPIANKYREGKMKSTLEREWNSTWNCWKGNTWSQSHLLEFSLVVYFLVEWVNITFWSLEKSNWNVALLVVCYSLLLNTVVKSEEFKKRYWHNGFKWPVLKHGPRSLTCLRVFGCLKPMRVMKVKVRKVVMTCTDAWTWDLSKVLR